MCAKFLWVCSLLREGQTQGESARVSEESEKERAGERERGRERWKEGEREPASD
jgi:hypothetical protein